MKINPLSFKYLKKNDIDNPLLMSYACKLHPKKIIIKRKVAVNDQIFDNFF